MKLKYKVILQKKLNEWMDEIDDFPFYIGDKTIDQFSDAVEVVFDAMEEAAKLESEAEL